MPCAGPTDAEHLNELSVRHAKVEAALCAVLTLLETELHLTPMLAYLDYKEAGITRQWLEEWWRDHKAKDAARRARENEAETISLLRARALGKLSKVEREALGFR